MKKMAVSFSKEIPNANLRVISLGAGVQSSVMALMAAKGEITPMPDCAIFADTQFEPESVYEHLEWLEERLPYPVHKVTVGNIKEDALKGENPRGKQFVTMPFFTETGLGKRQCTSDYKIDPIRNKTRELLGLKKRQKSKGLMCETWIGISMDEIQRVKDSRESYRYEEASLPRMV
jgi:3'-phosphoadenosine 5'-phosphosulfate sulfotransferase (PAPS reductase)/FAD synthetase